LVEYMTIFRTALSQYAEVDLTKLDAQITTFSA